MEVNNEAATESKPSSSESLLAFHTRHKYGCILGHITSAALSCKGITAVPHSSLAYICNNIFPQPVLYIFWGCLIKASSFLLDEHFYFREIKWLQFFPYRLSQFHPIIPYHILCCLIDFPFQCSHPTDICRHNYVLPCRHLGEFFTSHSFHVSS